MINLVYFAQPVSSRRKVSTWRVNTMNLVFKKRNSVFKTRNCALKTTNFVFKMMEFAGAFPDRRRRGDD